MPSIHKYVSINVTSYFLIEEMPPQQKKLHSWDIQKLSQGRTAVKTGHKPTAIIYLQPNSSFTFPKNT